MKKRLLALLLSLVLVVSLLPVGALAVDGSGIPDDNVTGDGPMTTNDRSVTFKLYTTQLYKMLMTAADIESCYTTAVDVDRVELLLKVAHPTRTDTPDMSRVGELTAVNDYWTFSDTNRNDTLEPSNIVGIRITYNDDRSVVVSSSNIELNSDISYGPLGGELEVTYEISSDNKNIVAFYNSDDTGVGEAGVQRLYYAVIVDDNQSVGEDKWPKEPTYISYIFGNWSTEESGGDAFIPSTNVSSDMNVFAQKLSGSDVNAGARIWVMNGSDALKNRYVELYNAQNNASIGINDVDWSTFRIRVNGTSESTNEDYYVSDLTKNEWVEEYSYYLVYNYNAPAETGSTHNDHISYTDIQSMTLFAELVDSEDVCAVNVSEGGAPGEFSTVISGQTAVDDSIWIFTINAPPTKPSDEDLTGLLTSAVKVTCTNKAEHTAATYDLLPDSFYVGEVVYTTAGYTCTVTVEAEKYVEKYSNSHTLAEGEENSKPITLVYNNGWTVPENATPVNFNVTCDAPAPAPKLSVDKSVDKTTAEVGDVLTYTITITNTGDVPVTDVTVRDNMWGEGKVEIIHVEDVTYGLSVDGGYWNAVMADGPYGTVETLAPDATWVCTYSYTVKESDAGETLINTVTVSGDDEASDTVTVDVPEVPYKILVSFVDENGTPIVPQQAVEVGGCATPPIEDDGRNIDGWEYNGVAYTGDYNYETLADLVTAKDGWNEVDHAGYLTFNAVYEPKGNEVYNVYFVIPNEEGGSFDPHNEDDDARYTTKATYNKEDDTYEVDFPEVVLNDGYELTGWNIIGKETNHWDAIAYEMTGVEHYANDHDLTIEAVVEKTKGNEVYNVYFVIPNEEGGSFDPHNEDDDARYTTKATYNKEDDTYEVDFPEVVLNDGYELTGWNIIGKETNHWDAIAYEMTGVEHYANDHDLTIEAVVEKTKGNEVYNVYFVIPNEEGGTFNPSNEGDGARYTTTAYYDEVGDTYKVEFPEVVLNDGYELTGWRIVGKETVTWDPVTWEMTAVEHYAIDHNLTIEAIVKAVDAPDMTVDKTVNKPVAEVGDTIKYTITVKNTGNVELTNVAVKDTMFEKADSFIGMPSGAVLTGNTVTIPTLGVGETATITYTYTVRYCDEGKLISNTATVTSEETGTDPEDPIDDTVVVRVDDRDPIIPPIDDDDDEDEFVPKWLNTEDHYAYIVGYEDGTIKPNNDITRAEVATIFFRLLTDNARERYWSTTNDFSDIAAESWYNNAISTLSNMGIINGYEDGTFKPNAPITRAEFTAIATRFFDYEAEYDGAFNDVSARAWYADYVQAAVDMGLVDGYPDGGFHPDAYITRAEACTIVNRVLHRVPHEDHLLSESVMNTWPDNPKSAWYYEDMQEATNSHDYDWIREDGETVEDWTKKLPERDWSALETEWATAYSR